ncbi:hypothetical protein [Shewanella sp. GD03713]|uniref:hypothetical protein n=1 Tax=Shewanella sp. GD03713 TaxID=2975372 RepID=UPI0024488071|nr:hypothetical protein [Shewanella sp. GD03713]MDH1472558.1 hypothetical protein [Shewanella sp. GD03713]
MENHSLRKVTRQLFDSSKIILAAGESPTLYRRLVEECPEIEPERTVAVYLSKFVIEMTDEGKWGLMLDRSVFVEADISVLEDELFNYLYDNYFQIDS